MALLDDVKIRLGVFYSDPNKDLEIQQMIDGAKNMFEGAGWDTSAPSPSLTEAIILYCKMAQSNDPSQLTNHPVLINLIVQNRGGSTV